MSVIVGCADGQCADIYGPTVLGPRIATLSAGQQPVPSKELTNERLAAAITQATATSDCAPRARQLAAALATEGGTAPVVAALPAAG